MLNIAVLCSGGGTNLQALLDAAEGRLTGGRIACVIASKPGIKALQRAEGAGVPALVIERRGMTAAAFDGALTGALERQSIDLVVLAGFLCILGPRMLQTYRNRIINVHPSLIPAFCGDGFYGLRVHEAALRYGVKVTGATVHFVNEVVDGGPIILQKAVEVREGDTPEILQRRVMEEAEWRILPEAVSLYCAGRLHTGDDNIVRILPEGAGDTT